MPRDEDYSIRRAGAGAGPPRPPALPGLVSLPDLAGKEPPARRWCVPDWIPDRNVTSLYGDGGTGKSLLAMMLATACATGTDWLGMPLARRRVLYLSCEDDTDELHRRQEAINRVLGRDMADFADLKWLVRPGDDNILMNFDKGGKGKLTTFANALLKLCKEEEIRLLIIDTAADTFGGNEIIRTEVRAFLTFLRRIAIELDGAVVLLAHPSVAGMNGGGGYSGSTAWRGGVRSLLTFEMDNGEEGDPHRRILTRRKANYAATGTSLAMRYVGGAFIPESAPVNSGGLMEEVIDETTFLNKLRALLDAGQCPSNSPKREEYAPKLMKRTFKDLGDVTIGRLEKAMHSLIGRGEVVQKQHWKGAAPLVPHDYDLSNWRK